MNLKSAAVFALGVTAGIAVSVAVATMAAQTDNKAAKNKAIAIEFYNRALNQLDFEKAAELIGDKYVQHNPHAIDGPAGLKNHLAMLKKDFPKNHGDIKRAIAEGDLVALHIHSKRTPESRGNAIVDLFRIENGKVVEHWDVVQAVPEKALNDNTMF
jgi:predicted SnoaL-like aldol condensation-catalyzing enzyme